MYIVPWSILTVMYFVLQPGTEEKEQDQSTQSLDLGFPDDDEDGPQPEGKQIISMQITVQ